jgi:cell division protease FtsH
LPKEQFLYQTEQLFDEMCMALGGRAAEEIVFEKISTGALSDLERITKMAYSMVTMYGMNDQVGNISYYDSKQSDYNFTKPYSEATAELIDQEVKKLIEQAYERTKKLLIEKRKELDILANELLDKEIIYQYDLEKLIGKRPFERLTTYQAYTEKEDDEDKKEEESDNQKNGDQIESIKESIKSEVEKEDSGSTNKTETESEEEKEEKVKD